MRTWLALGKETIDTLTSFPRGAWLTRSHQRRNGGHVEQMMWDQIDWSLIQKECTFKFKPAYSCTVFSREINGLGIFGYSDNSLSPSPSPSLSPPLPVLWNGSFCAVNVSAFSLSCHAQFTTMLLYKRKVITKEWKKLHRIVYGQSVFTFTA